MKGIVIAGTGSGVGKTSVTTGLMRKLSRRMTVQGFKVGPDFIDPMYHRSATGRPSRNLDSFMMSKDVMRDVALYGSKGADISIVEGVRGLYEGSSGKNDSGSTAEIAKILGFPVVLVVNSRSLTRSAAAMVRGFMDYDKDIEIAGVILNNVSGAQHENKLRDAMEGSDIPVLGVVGRNAEHKVPERHLGLNTDESDNRSILDGMESLAEGVDTDSLIGICRGTLSDGIGCPYKTRDSGLKAAIPMDDAFCFYYRENIECLEASGVRVEYFSPLNGDPLPDADIYYLGGGYPEVHMERLSENRDFFQGLKTAYCDNKVILGECGGMLAMCSSIECGGNIYEAAGIFEAKAEMIGKRHGPAYIEARSNSNCVLFNENVRGHAFHYSGVIAAPDSVFGFDIERGIGLSGMRDGLVSKNSMGSYMHQHALSAKDWAGGIVERCI
ncbi:MAG: hydrogenobyrinic acid a,c-diamide synthase (glutamine-hydrolyzing) [Candidatus Methanoplasma sp.]|nr:hydrogenobyrinic acid a,c-diamide synthase (glutamine-hydrolyzing) [Candidatus Methanoplasma sp.]